jgi:hypothetical protein
MRVLSFAICLSVLLGTARAQLTIDATVPIRERHRQPASGSGGSSGYKLPIVLTAKTIGAAPDDDGRTVLEFTLTNEGKKDLEIPISPHPRDFEPEDPSVGYSVKNLSL